MIDLRHPLAVLATRMPGGKAQFSRFRKGLSEAGVEERLKTTIKTAAAMGAVRKNDLQRVVETFPELH